MEAKLTIGWCPLDKEYEIFIACNNVWVWFYLGYYLRGKYSTKRTRIFPYDYSRAWELEYVRSYHIKSNCSKRVAKKLAEIIKGVR